MTSVHPRIQIECQVDNGTPQLEIERLVRAAVARVCSRLAIAPRSIAPFRVLVVAEGGSSAVAREIRVVPRSDDPRLDWLDWLELLVSHEVTHLAMRDAWGTGPVLVWEGLPVHLGDDRVRARRLGHPYHGWVRALDHLNARLPLVELLTASSYYRRRADPRVDLQAGSFCGFLLAHLGPRRLASFVRAAAPPTGPDPEAQIDAAAEAHLGARFRPLENTWLRFVRDEIAEMPALVERLRARPWEGAAARPPHCDRCFEPLPNDAAAPLCSRCTG